MILVIYVYNLSTSTEMQITSGDLDRYSPEIYEDKIIWRDSSSGIGNIYVYNLSTSEEIRITTGNFYLGSYSVHGDRVVWVDERNQNPDIYMYNTSTHTENQITSNKSGKGNPSIYGNRIVWTDWRNKYKGNVHPDPYIENADIYMCTISAVGTQLEKPVANFFANKTSGNAPLKVLFTDNGTGAPTFWHWDFGDGTNSKIYRAWKVRYKPYSNE